MVTMGFSLFLGDRRSIFRRALELLGANSPGSPNFTNDHDLSLEADQSFKLK